LTADPSGVRVYAPPDRARAAMLKA